MRSFLRVLIGFLAVVAVLQAAEAKNATPLTVFDTTAGRPALILLTGKAKEIVDLTIFSPSRSTVTQRFQLNEKGLLQHWYGNATLAGTYEVRGKGEKAFFTVRAGAPDFMTSPMSLSDTTAFVGESIEGSLSLKDSYGNAITGKAIDFVVKGTAGVHCSAACKTNQSGVLAFKVSSEKPGLKKLIVRDSDDGKILGTEDLGFIPLIELPKRRVVQESLEDYIPVTNPLKARGDAQGNDDQNIAKASLWDFLAADLSDTSSEDLEKSFEELVALKPSAGAGRLEIIFGTDKTGKYEREKTVKAHSALDFFVKAVDEREMLLSNYTGTLHFTLEPGGKVPEDYSFTELDAGMALFELALVLPAGSYTLKVEDKVHPEMKGEVMIIAEGSAVNLNNTNIILNLESPVSGGFYSKSLSVEGSVNMDNTELEIKESGKGIKTLTVDASKRFSTALELPDGKHRLEVIATYLADGSITATTVDFEIDRTAPVISKIESQLSPARAGGPFTMTVEAEEGSMLKAFINNRAYEFTGVGTAYTLRAEAPLDLGTYSVNLQISDKFGNSESSPDVAKLVVLEALKPVSNLFGIPGMETLTMSWDPVRDAALYEVQHTSLLGQSEILKTEKTSITLDQLVEDGSYIVTVIAKDAKGNTVSLLTESKTLSPLPPELSPPGEPKILHGASKTPRRQPGSGPEVYIVIFASIILLNGYGKLRKALARVDDQPL